MEARFSHVRSLAPQVLRALTFAASVSPSEVADAVSLLQAMNADGHRHVPGDTPVEFVPARWRPYLDTARTVGDENRFKHYWELCVLFALQGCLRSGEIETYPGRQWRRFSWHRNGAWNSNGNPLLDHFEFMQYRFAKDVRPRPCGVQARDLAA